MILTIGLKPMGHQLVGKSFGIFIGSFIKGLGFHGR
jgi:hypothetical protein